MSTAEASAVTGLSPQFIRRHSAPDGTGDIPAVQIGSTWLVPGTWVAQVMFPGQLQALFFQFIATLTVAGAASAPARTHRDRP
jgi:hypothetical protein